MADLKKISVVTVINKGSRFYMTALKSFLYQTYQNSEFIIIDNSGQNIVSSKISKYLNKDERIKIYTNAVSVTYKEILKQIFEYTTGSFIAFLDTKDYWVIDKLSRQIGFMMRFGTPMSHTSYGFGDDKCHLLPIGCYHITGDLNLLNYDQKNPVCISTLMINKDKVHIDFSKYEQDYEKNLMLFLLKNGIVSSGISDVLTLCRPVFDKKTQSKIENMIHELLLSNPEDKENPLRLIEYHAYNALNIEGLKLDPSICIGHDVITSLNRLRNFKI